MIINSRNNNNTKQTVLNQGHRKPDSEAHTLIVKYHISLFVYLKMDSEKREYRTHVS